MNRNMKKTACILLFLAGMALPAMAQNSIDRMVKQHSTTGKSTFTSAVERDPATRKVVKVVNILKSRIWMHSVSKSFRERGENGR